MVCHCVGVPDPGSWPAPIARPPMKASGAPLMGGTRMQIFQTRVLASNASISRGAGLPVAVMQCKCAAAAGERTMVGHRQQNMGQGLRDGCAVWYFDVDKFADKRRVSRRRRCTADNDPEGAMSDEADHTRRWLINAGG